MKTSKRAGLWKYTLLVLALCVFTIPQVAGAVLPIPTGPKTLGLDTPDADPTPDYYTTANWANSPPIAKFVDTLPGLNSPNNLGQQLPVAVPDKLKYPGSDYYIIALEQYTEKMHSDLQPTTLRGYVQLNEDGTYKNGSPHYLGPVIVAQRDRPVRILFKNKLPTGVGGDLFIPVDKSVMGAGKGPADAGGNPCDNTPLSNTCANYTENRAAIHLHGGRTPWISDGTPHQWIIPAAEQVNTPFKQGVSLQNVPDMPAPGPGETTYYFTNQQSARLMFYHDHAFGITRLNVYAGEAAGYVITDPHEQDLVDRGLLPGLKSDGQTVVMGGQIPLVIQDKTFVDANTTTKFIFNPATGLFDQPITVPKVRETDPLWNWGGDVNREVVNGVRTPVTGDLWLPHVYMPAQTSIAGAGGVNPFGRWMYGPWFYPATVVDVGPKTNPYYDARCSSSNPFILADCETPGQPTLVPGTPNVSMGMEAFQDSVVVNGTVFPTMTVDPTAYRFRILNAASDRFQNLSFYIADDTPANLSDDARLPGGAKASTVNGVLKHNRTEVKMAQASPNLAAANNWPVDWPVDGRPEMVPDPGTCQPGGVNCSNFGPSFLQIGTEGGFLPAPVRINQQPITYVTDPTAFWVGNVDKMALALGPAERADVIVDFSAYAGKTLILYNDAPAAWPARVAGYDYYTGAPDLRDSGGFGTGGTWDPITGTWVGGTGPLPGHAPNTRTVLQVIVKDTAPAPFNSAPLEAEFKAGAPVVNTATYQNPAPTKTLFERSQEPIIVGQAAYAGAYPNSYFPANFPWEGINQINDHFLDFVTVKGEQVHAITEPKGLHDEMGASFDPIYGRMSGNLAMQIPNPTTLTANLILYGFSDVPTENVNNSVQYDVKVLPGVNGMAGTLGDGTQIWKISHNGVDTHPIHFHIFDVQLINRVGWDGQILMPEPNELGWKDTVKISPLEDTIVAIRPRAPALPFGIPESIRPLNPSIPLGSPMGFNSIDPLTGQAYVAPSPYAPQVVNQLHNFGWEYVWHCHILSHEEMDMMRPIVLYYEAALPPSAGFTASLDANGVNWTDPTPFLSGIPADPESYRSTSASSEIGYNVYKGDANGFPVDQNGKMISLNAQNGLKIIPANSTSYSDPGASTSGQIYVVEAFNAKGSTFAFADGSPNYVPSATISAGGTSFTKGTIVPLTVTHNFPAQITVTEVVFYDGQNIIETVTGGGLTTNWITSNANVNAVLGKHTVYAKMKLNLGGDVVTAPIVINLTGALVADFTASTGANPPSLSFAKCDVINFISTSTGTVAPTPNVNPGTSYSWLIGGNNYNTANVSNITLPPGNTYPVTLGVLNVNNLGVTITTDQITKNITIDGTNTAPTITTVGGVNGVYTVNPGQSLTLAGVGADVDSCDVLTYSWDLDGKNGYEFVGATNPGAITYNALWKVLGAGTFTINFKVSDPSGAFATQTAQLVIGAPAPPAVSLTAPVNGANIITGTNITLTAVVTPGASATINKVEFYDGATLLSTDTTAPYSFVWFGATLGAHSLTAKATDSKGLVTTSSIINVFVAPAGSVVTPNGGETLIGTNTYNVTWTMYPNATSYVLYYSATGTAPWTYITTINNGSTTNYNWVVPNIYTVNAKFRVQALIGASYVSTDVSNSAFTINPTVNAPASITVPSGSSTGSYTVSWSASTTAGVTYTVQESTVPNFASFTEATNAVSPFGVTGKMNGTYYYRVKAVHTSSGVSSSWTTGVNGCVVNLLGAVTAPNGGESLTGTSTYNVTWTMYPNATSYVLYYSTTGTAPWTYITTISNGSTTNYNWVVPNVNTSTAVFKIQSLIGASYVNTDVSNGVFTISPTVNAPVSISVPSSSGSGNYSISWAASTTSGVTYTIQESTVANFASFTETTNVVSPLAVTGKTSGIYYYRVKAVHAATGVSSAWTAGINGCTVTLPVAITSPNGGETLTALSTFNVTWTPYFGATSYILYYSATGAAPWTYITTVSGSTTNYNWTVPNVSTNTALFRIQALIGTTYKSTDLSNSVFTITP